MEHGYLKLFISGTKVYSESQVLRRNIQRCVQYWHVGEIQVGTQTMRSDGLLKVHQGGTSLESMRSRLETWTLACALPRCPVENNLQENHHDDNYETYKRFPSLCTSRELKTFPRKSPPTKRGRESELSLLGPLGHYDWPLTRERSEKHQHWERRIDAAVPGLWAQKRGSPGGADEQYSPNQSLGRWNLHDDRSSCVTAQSAKWGMGH